MSWRISDGSLHLSWASLSPDLRARFSRHEPLLHERGLLIGDILRATWEEWAQLGVVPLTPEDELVDDWASLQDAFSQALSIDRQQVSVRSVGHIGAAGASLRISVDNRELSTPNPFVDGWTAAPPLPAIWRP